MSEIGEELKAMGLPHLDFEGEGSTKYWAPTPASWDPPFEGDPTPGRAGAVRLRWLADDSLVLHDDGD